MPILRAFCALSAVRQAEGALSGDNKNMNLEKACIADVLKAVREAKPSATEIAETCYAQIAGKNEAINAYLALSRERALTQAAAMDEKAAKGDPLPVLAGVPVGIKDVLVMKGSPANRGIAHPGRLHATLRRHHRKKN